MHPSFRSGFPAIKASLRQPGDFWRSSYSILPVCSSTSRIAALIACSGLRPMQLVIGQPPRKRYLCCPFIFGECLCISPNKNSSISAASFMTAFGRSSTVKTFRDKNRSDSTIPDEQSDEPKCSLLSSAIVVFLSRTGLSCALSSTPNTTSFHDWNVRFGGYVDDLLHCT